MDISGKMPRMLSILAMLFLLSAVSFGQATDSNVVGTVTDPTGAAVAAATVTAANKDTGVKYTTTTNSEGEYRINNVPVGRYDISATAKGFNTAIIAGLELQLNHTASANLVLQVGAVTTSVDVQEAVAAIDTATAQIQTTYDSRSTDLGLAGISKPSMARAFTI